MNTCQLHAMMQYLLRSNRLSNSYGNLYVGGVRLTGDFACVKAKKADRSGNLMFHSTAQNFNPDCAKAGR